MAEPTPLRVRRLAGEADLARWDAWVAASPQGDPFATSAWLASACAITGAAFAIHVVERGEEFVGAAYYATKRRVGLRFGYGLPLAAYSTWLFRAPTSLQSRRTISERIEVSTALLAVPGRPRNVSHLLSPSIVDVRPWIWRGWRATPRYTCVLDVTRPLDLSDSARRHVRKCRDAGMTTAVAWDFDVFWDLFRQTSARQGFGIRLDRAGFARLARDLHAAGLAWMVTVSTAQGEPAASQIVLSIPGAPSAFMWTAGVRDDLLSSGVSSHIMNEIAGEAGRRGCVRWDLCGADLPGVARFKSELGAELVPYFQVDAPRTWDERGYDLMRRVARRVLPAR